MANKTIGRIPYSLSMKPTKPGDADSPKKLFANIQSDETIDLGMLADHMAEHNSPFSRGTIAGVLRDMVNCTVELLRQGKTVKMDGLASFALKASCTPSDTVQEFNPATDLKLGIRVAVDSTAVSQVNTDVDFEYVMTREQQAAAKAAAKQTLPQKETTDDGGSTGGSGNNGGNGGNDGNDDNAEGQTE